MKSFSNLRLLFVCSFVTLSSTRPESLRRCSRFVLLLYPSRFARFVPIQTSVSHLFYAVAHIHPHIHIYEVPYSSFRLTKTCLCLFFIPSPLHLVCACGDAVRSSLALQSLLLRTVFSSFCFSTLSPNLALPNSQSNFVCPVVVH